MPLTPFLKRQNLNIEALSLDAGMDQTSQLAECLSYIPSAKILYIGIPYTTDADLDSLDGELATLNEEFFALITPAPSSPPSSPDGYLCPCLEDVDFRFPHASDITDGTILRFILARTSLAPEGVSRLRRARFTLERPRDIDILPELQQVIDEGLELCLTYSEHDTRIKSPFVGSFLPYHNLEIARYQDEWAPGHRFSRRMLSGPVGWFNVPPMNEED